MLVISFEQLDTNFKSIFLFFFEKNTTPRWNYYSNKGRLLHWKI